MAFSLSSITSSLSSAFGGGKGGSVLGIDIGSSSVKIVQLRPSKGVAILETYGEIALGPYANTPIGKTVKLQPEKTAEAILDLMKEANVTADQGGISIPFSSSLISVLDLPKVDAEQLKRMVPIEARKYIPVPASEVTLDWFAIPAEEEADAFDRLGDKPTTKARGQEVLIAAIHNETVRNYQAVTAAVGIQANFFEIEIFSAIRSSLGQGVMPVLIIDMGAATTKIYVVERGIVRVSHLITAGGQHMTETLGRTLNWEFEKAERVKREVGLLETRTYAPEENARIHEALLSTLTRVFSEANRVLLSYGKRYNKNVSQVILTGGGASLPGLLSKAPEELGVQVSLANPFARAEAPAFLGDVLNQIGPGFAVSVGLALRKLKQDLS